MSENGRKPHLSISAIETLARCGEQYRRRYIEGEKIPPGIAALVGKGVDDSVTANLGAKIETGALLDSDAVIDTARDSVVRQWEAGEVTLTEEETDSGPQKVKGAAIDKAAMLSLLHAASTAPTIEPTAVQRFWRLELSNFPFDLIGYIDVDEARRVRDTKTSGKTPAASTADTSDQLTAYSLARKIIDGNGVPEVVLDYLIDKRTPQALTLRSTRTDADFAPFLNRVEASAAVIEAGAFLPASPDSWACSKKFCGYWSTCKFARRGKEFQS